MSTAFAFLLGCAVHLGTVPSRGFVVAEVRAPVVEPGVDEAVRAGVAQALAAHRATGPEPLVLVVERADWLPTRRSGDVVLYQATLAVRFAITGGERLVTVQSVVADPGTAGEAIPVRASAFAELAGRAAEQGVAWLSLTSP